MGNCLDVVQRPLPSPQPLLPRIRVILEDSEWGAIYVPGPTPAANEAPSDEATRLTRWLTRCQMDWGACNLLYHRHWHQDIAPALMCDLDLHLPHVLASLVCEWLDVAAPSSDHSDAFYLRQAGDLLAKNNGEPLDVAEQALLRALHRECFEQMRPRTHTMLDRIDTGRMQLLDVYRILELVCENLEVFGLEDDPATAELVWRDLLLGLTTVAERMRPHMDELTTEERLLWHMQHAACFAQLASRFRCCTSVALTEQAAAVDQSLEIHIK
jgi:hypothetical protein